jgi:ubiquitin C-terminal hydrolase
MTNFTSITPQRTKKENDWQIMPQDKEKAASGYVGLYNPGCICYMISIFQQLFMIPSFRSDIMAVNSHNPDEAKEDNMLYQFQFLFANLLRSEKQYANPKNFTKSFKDWDG